MQAMLSPPAAPPRSPAPLADTLKRADLRVYQVARCSYALLKHERKAGRVSSLGRTLEMWRRGFFAESAIIYDFPRNDPRDYLSDYQHFLRCSRINAWGGFYGGKLTLRSYLHALGLAQAETVAVVMSDRILGDPYGPDRGLLTPDQLLDRLREGAERGYVVKPEAGWCGEDIFLLTLENGQLTRRRGRDAQPFDLDRLRHGPFQSGGKPPTAFLIERRLEQAAFWARLFPGSANTIRVLTLWTPGEPAPFVARAVQRIGTADTVPTDNWSGGGISAPIDPATGQLGLGRMHPLKGRRETDRFTHHPDTGAVLEGAVLPDWATIRDTVLRAAASVPFNPMAGWDVLVRSDGVPVLLEANGNSDVNLLQVHGGLLRDPAVRRFYHHFGVV